MKRRVIAFICVLTLVLGVMAFSTAAQEEKATFRVGYAKVDINPWVDPDDHTKGVIPVPLGGYGDQAYRLAMGVADDDGEAGISGNEGLFATCIAVTDNDDTTMLFLSFDGLHAEEDMTRTVREGIVSAVAADSGLAANTKIAVDQITVSASHSHYAPEYKNMTEAKLKSAHGAEVGAQLWTLYSAYKERVIQQMINVALDALHDRETASQVKKTETDALDATGYQLNGVRHYELTAYKEFVQDTTGAGEHQFSGDELVWVAGDNFGSLRYAAGLGLKLGKSYRTSGAIAGYYVKTAEHVTESNDTLYTLEFSFNSGKDTIMLANWRGHTILNDKLDVDADGNVLENPARVLYYDYEARTGDTYNIKGKSHYVSGDYANAFRNLMKKQGYDVAFVNGAAGNVNNDSRAFDPDVGDDGWGGNLGWTRFFTNGELTDISGQQIAATELPATAFAHQLMKVAMDTSNKVTTICAPGTIRTAEVRYGLEENTYNIDYDVNGDAWYAAYKACNTDESAGTAHYPYKYVHTDGTVCVISSRYHCANIGAWLRRKTGEVSDIDYFAKYELNAIMLGEQIAFVSAPGELFDYYDAEGSRAYEDNDWLELIDETYGTPFVLGYTNGGQSYLPNSLAFEYNADNENLGIGSYESVNTQYAKGGGEEMIAQFGRMLDSLNGKSAVTTKVAYCQACDKEVVWEPLVAQNNGDKYWYSGHYYLYEDINDANTGGKRIRSQEVVCLDLNGHRLQTNERIGGRTFVVEGSATLNIFDSSAEKTGVISGQGEALTYTASSGAYSRQNGGTIYCQSQSTLNLYGGTIERRIAKDPYHESSYNANGGYYKYGEYLGVDLGGTIYAHATSKVNVYGGAITDGTAATAGSCVYSHSTSASNGGAVLLAGDARVSNVYIKSTSPQNYLTVSGTYTGRATVTLQSAADGQVIGKLTDNGNILRASLTCTNDDGLYVVAQGENLVLTNERPAATAATNGDKTYLSLQDAIDDYTAGVITLTAPDVGTVTIPAGKTVTLDMNGFNLTNVVANGTLLVKDSDTDDFTVADGVYGKITGQITGDVQAVPVIDGAGYLKVTDDNDGSISFHKVELAVTDMVMSSSQVSIYYNCKFAGDQLVQGEVDQYGMAISLKGTPQLDAETKQFTADCQRSWFTQFKAGINSGSSTRLYNIMKTTNGYLTNKNNAEAPVYIRAYIKLNDGTYLLGRDYDRGFSLRNLLEAVNNGETWRALTVGQKEDLIELYNNYTRVYNGWSIDYLRNAANNKPMQLSQTEKEAFAKVVEFDLPENFRDALIDYMLECAEIEWVAKETYTTLQDNQTWSVDLTYNKGTVYHGIPYAAYTASAAQFSDAIVDGEYYPSKLGYLNEYGLGCTSSITLGFQQFVSYDGPGRSWLPGHKLFWFEKVGDYDTADSPTSSKTDICDLNGEQKMYEAYAQLQKGDIIFNVKDLSTYLYHSRAVVCVPTVVRLADGTIDPEQSYVTTIEASNKFDTTRTDGVNTTWQVNHQYTFANLYQKGYVPITLEAYSKDRTDMECPYVGLDTEITAEMLAKGEFAGTIKSNFPILYASVDVLDENGSKVAYVENGNLYNIREVEVSSLSAVFDQLESGRTYTFVLKGGLARGTAELVKVSFTYQ